MLTYFFTIEMCWMAAHIPLFNNSWKLDNCIYMKRGELNLAWTDGGKEKRNDLHVRFVHYTLTPYTLTETLTFLLLHI